MGRQRRSDEASEPSHAPEWRWRAVSQTASVTSTDVHSVVGPKQIAALRFESSGDHTDLPNNQFRSNHDERPLEGGSHHPRSLFCTARRPVVVMIGFAAGPVGGSGCRVRPATLRLACRRGADPLHTR